ncbi:hypothetical protein BsIDN1_42510 [Bacillus safensis]|uniref:Tetrahydrofolate dehydrogenase/cyclohydrolase catalytic domain-containing protein n=1 Tax=Bacillus safensis TaxID=561879 RepID=A0A5S9MBY8_BACIA|nr:hypothetical protein BsIDN1_42510 [Bacillus safensis]
MGMHFQLDHLDASLTEEELLQLIDQYNANDQFHGILVQLPLPKNIFLKKKPSLNVFHLRKM